MNPNSQPSIDGRGPDVRLLPAQPRRLARHVDRLDLGSRLQLALVAGGMCDRLDHHKADAHQTAPQQPLPKGNMQ